MKRTLGGAAQAVGGTLAAATLSAGTLSAGDVAFGEVSTDSRTLEAGALFVALHGPNFDGTEFVAGAAARGAVAAVVDRPVASTLPLLVVGDTLGALQTLAQVWRKAFTLPVVAVAGSNGKTTAKEMTSAILARGGSTLATRGNLNNHIGVPLTLLRLDASHRSAVIEMGANRIGDVAELVPIARPTVGLITNAGAEHLEGFGDLDGVAKGEGEMVACLAPGATAVINADDAYAGYWRSVAQAGHVVSFGVHSPADFRALDAEQRIENGGFVTRFTLECPLGRQAITLQAGGEHNIANATAAAAAAASAGATLEHIALGLAEFRPVAGRLQLKAGLHDSWVIDDSYNANPSSVQAGLDVLRALTGARWMVLGDMAELGGHSAHAHAQIGVYARGCGVARLFAMGEESRHAVDSFGAGGEWFADWGALVGRLQAELAPGVTLLVKGSRVNRLERVVKALLAGGALAGGAG